MLIAVVVGLIVFAFRPEPELPVALPELDAEEIASTNPENSTDSPDPRPSPKIEGLIVHEVRITGSPGGRIVETTLSGRSPVGSDLILDETSVSATTDAGEPLNRFFEPFVEPPSLLASEDTLATVRWWLESPADTIWLEVKGRKVRADLP